MENLYKILTGKDSNLKGLGTVKSFKVKMFFVALFYVLQYSNFSKAQSITPQTYGTYVIFNTGINSNYSATLPLGNHDNLWQCSVNSPGNPGPTEVVSGNNSCSAWSPATGTSAWIAPANSNCSPKTYYGCNNIIDYYYTATFTLAGAHPVFMVDFIIFASGWIQNIDVNGFTAYNSFGTASNHPNHVQSGMNFRWCTKWKPGLNRITIHVRNAPNIASNCQHTGLKLESWGPPPHAYPSIAGNSIACVGSTNIYSVPTKTVLAIPNPTAHAYQWSKPSNFGGVLSNTNVITTTVTGPNSGTIGVTIHSVYVVSGHTFSYCASTAGFSVTVPPPLNITTNGTNVCMGNTKQLTASGAGSFTWFAPPGQTQISTSNVALVSPMVATTYTVNSQTNPGNCPYSKTITIHVLPKPTVTLTASSASVCQGNPVALWATPGMVSYTWLPTPSGNPALSMQQYTPSVSPMSLFIVNALAANGCTNQAFTSVSVHPNPTVQATANPTVICQGQTATVSATGANSYTWNFQQPIVGQTLAVTPSISTVYMVIGSNNFNCSNSKTVQVHVLGSPQVTVSPPFICTGFTNTFSASGAISYTWQLATSPPQTIVAQSFTMQVSAATPYTVCGNGPNNNCIGCFSGNLTPGSPVPIVVPHATLCTNASTCAILTASSSLNAPISYTWGTIGPFGASAQFCPAVTTTYTVSATSPSACANSATADIIVISDCCSQPTTGLTVLNHTAGLGGSYTNTSYLLNASITLTSSTTFSHSEVWMKPGVKITVPSGMYVEMERSRFFACGINMWQGFEIQDGGWVKTLNGNLHSNLIEDAEIGIDLSNISVTNSSPLPPINLEGVVFNKNFIGIRMANSDQALDSLAIGINGCVFTSRTFTYVSHPSPNAALDWPSASDNCLTTTVSAALRCALIPTAGLAPPFISNLTFPFTNLKQPHAGQPGHIGIQIHTIGLQSPTTQSVGLPAGVQFGITYTTASRDFNLFDGLGVGIEVTDASLVTKNNVFQNMKEYGFPNASGLYGGKGIMHVIQPNNLMNARLYLTGSSIGDGNRFYDCVTGVFASHVYENTIRFCLFRSKHNVSTALNPWSNPGDTGVSICTNRLNQAIAYNEFNNLKHGVVLTTGTASCLYDVGGSSVALGTFIHGLDIKYNYFGPLLNSTAGYGSGAANLPGSEYMSSAVELLSPNTFGWYSVPTTTTGVRAFITANRMNRVFRGISVDGFEDTGFWITENKIEIEDDLTFTSSPNPAWGYGIAIKNNSENLSVKNNSLEAVNVWNMHIPTPTISLIYMNNNFNNSSTFPASPIVECNSTKNAYIGYHFEGWNGNAIWEGNEMCNHHYGMALTNNGEIGMQGSATLGSGNKWVDNVFLNCDVWGPLGVNARWQTYSENSNANNSFLWVIQDQLGIPEFNPTNNTGNMNTMNYFFGPSSNINIAPVNRLMDCIYDPFAPIPPTWRLVGAGNLNTPANSYKFRIYPNPTSSKLSIESLESFDEAQVELYSIDGRLLQMNTTNGGQTFVLDLENYSAAIYFVVIKRRGETLLTSKIIKTQ